MAARSEDVPVSSAKKSAGAGAAPAGARREHPLADLREESGKDFHLTERAYGAFRRSFRLPEDADEAKIEAGFAKGVLTVSIPKSREAASREQRIPVKGS